MYIYIYIYMYVYIYTYIYSYIVSMHLKQKSLQPKETFRNWQHPKAAVQEAKTLWH
jgi:hypothetical protein